MCTRESPRRGARGPAVTRSWSSPGSTAERGRAQPRPGPGDGEGGGVGARPPPHLARRGHGLALAPRPPRRGRPARPLRPAAAAAVGESTQSLTLSPGNGCRKVPAISPSSRGVPGALLRPPTAPGELWGRPRSAPGPRPARSPPPPWSSPTTTPRPSPSPGPAPLPSAARPRRQSLRRRRHG